MKSRKSKILYKGDVERLNAIREYICLNPDKDLGITTIALKFGIGESTLRRHFKQYYGQSLYQFIYEYRMEKALELLKEHRDNVTQIASALSYKNLSSFTRAFSKYYRRTPVHYLKM